MDFDYFYGRDTDAYQFIKIPLVFFESEIFSDLSIEAKVLYSFLLSRAGLSFKNNWLDEKRRVYIIFTLEEVMEKLTCGSEKAVKLFTELDARTGIGLIERKRRGQGKPSIIYVKDFMSIFKTMDSRLSKNSSQDFHETKLKTYENRSSRSSEIEALDFRESNGNYIEKNKINNSEIDVSRKKAHGSFNNVFLSDDDTELLRKQLNSQLENYIERLSAYIKSTGRDYQDHSATIMSWFLKDKGSNKKTGISSIEEYEKGEHL